ncbi:MAG: phage major capsid protein [Phycisphaerae bacterium]
MAIQTDVKDLKEERAGKVAEARKILEKAEEEGRDLTAEEREQWDKAMAEVGQLKTRADRLERQLALDAEMEASPGPSAGIQRADGPQTPQPGQDPPAGRQGPARIELRQSCLGEARVVEIREPQDHERRMQIFRRYLMQGERALATDPEVRALQADEGEAGGYLVAPERFQAELIAGLDDQVHVRRLARVLPPLGRAASLGAPSLDADPADPDWTAELAIGSEDSTMDFGKRELNPHPLAKYIKVSNTLLRRATLSVDQIVRSRLGYKVAVTQENAFLNGSGAGQPLGVFTASDNGISTSRDFSDGHTETELRFVGLQDALYNLKAQYRGRSAWLFHRDAVAQIAKLQDGDGRPIWQPSVRVGEPDRLLGRPFHESEYAPNTFTTGLYVGILADWQFYWIVDALTMQVQVLKELFAATNQSGYVIRYEGDGMPVLEEAFARVTLA